MKGGKREGAGRKALPNKKVVVSFKFTPETKDKVCDLRTKGVDVTSRVEEFIQSGCEV